MKTVKEAPGELKKEIIENLRKWDEKVEGKLRRKDVPGSLGYKAEKAFGTWNEAKKQAGLEIYEGRTKKYTDEEILEKLKEEAEWLGRSPTMGNCPNLAGLVQFRFESWNEAKKQAGLETYRAPSEKKKNDGEIAKAVLQVAQRRRIPRKSQMDQHDSEERGGSSPRNSLPKGTSKG